MLRYLRKLIGFHNSKKNHALPHFDILYRNGGGRAFNSLEYLYLQTVSYAEHTDEWQGSRQYQVR
jgi:hypothetical protein